MNAEWLNREIAALFGLVRVPTGTPDVAGCQSECGMDYSWIIHLKLKIGFKVNHVELIWSLDL